MHHRRTPSVSVIIPALNEAACIGRCIASVSAGRSVEIIVADGGSTDATVSIARRAGAAVVRSPRGRGRGRQMNAGAGAATGDVLLFLHADCTLSPGALDHLGRVLRGRCYSAGYFHMRIADPHPAFRLIELGSRLRARWLSRPYGDQGMFFRREFFHRIGGFPDVPIMEDLLIGRAARRYGPFLCLTAVVMSSPRRWRRDGIWRRVLRNWSVAVAHKRGVPLDELRTRYEGRNGMVQAPRAPRR